MKKLILVLHLAFYILPFASAQQHAWTDLFPNMPDTPTDTLYIGGETYYGSYIGMFFINDKVGWVTSTQQDEQLKFLIFHTTNGGQSWEIQKHWEYSQAIWMLDSLNGYLGDHAGFIMVTHDGGDTWSYHGAVGAPVTDITFAPGSDTGWVSVDESYYFWQITPQGVNQIDMGHLNYWTGISANDESVWICGGIQVFYWDLLQKVLIPELVVHSGYFSDIFFVDKDHGWIGNLGQIRGFVEYDYFWPEIFNTGELTVTCLHAIDTNNLWATVWDGRILHTSNASDYGYIKEANYYWSNVVWEEQQHPKTGNLLNAIQFLSPDCGYACGENNTILKYTEASVVEEKIQGKFRIFPNPVSSHFTVHIPDFGLQTSDLKLEIMDLFGRMVAEYDHPADLTFDISHLTPGVYFCRIHIGNRFYINKIVKV